MLSNRKRSKRAFLGRWLLQAAMLVLSQGAAAQDQTLTVAVAANVKYAFNDLAAEFRKESGIDVRAVLGSSGQLAAQIMNGAPFDVLLSADMEYPEALYKEKLAVTAPRVYANGVLVLWTRKPIDLGKGLAVLADPAVQKIAIANPKLAPYGREAIHALEHAGLRAAVEPKLVYGESIAQTSQYIDTGSADVGFTAKSVVLAPEVAGRGKWVEVPGDSYQPIAQGVVVLKHGDVTDPQNARKFVAFLFSPAARAIFVRYGYLLP